MKIYCRIIDKNLKVKDFLLKKSQYGTLYWDEQSSIPTEHFPTIILDRSFATISISTILQGMIDKDIDEKFEIDIPSPIQPFSLEEYERALQNQQGEWNTPDIGSS